MSVSPLLLSPSLSLAIDGSLLSSSVRVELYSTPAWPLRIGGRICWTDNEDGNQNGEIGIGTICEIKIQKGTKEQAHATFGITLTYIAPAIAPAATATEPFRGANVAVQSIELITSSSSEATTLFNHIVSILRETCHRRVIPSPPHPRAPSTEVPSALLITVENGINVTLHSRTPQGLQSEPSLIWIDWTNDVLHFASRTRLGADGERQNIPPTELYSSSRALSLGSLSDIFVGMHASIWADLVTSGVSLSDETTLTLAFSPTAADADDSTPPEDTIELHAQTELATTQQIILDAIQYANDWSETDSGQPIQADVIVTVDDACGAIAPDFYSGSPNPIEPTPTPAAAHATPVPVTGLPVEPTPVSIAESAPTPQPTPASTAVDDATPTTNHFTEPDMTSDPTMQPLIAGIKVAMFTSANPTGPVADLRTHSVLLKYDYDSTHHSSALVWHPVDGSTVVGVSGRTGRMNFSDLTDLFLGKEDSIFKDSQLEDLPEETCMSIYTVQAEIDQGKQVQDYKVHISTNDAPEREMLLSRIQYVLQHGEVPIEELTAAAVEAAPTPVPARPSRLKAPSVDLTVMVAEASAITAAALAAQRAATPKSSPSSRLSALSQPKARQSPPPPEVYTPQPVVEKPAEPKLSLKTVAKLSSLSQPRKKVDTAEEERKAKEAETMTSKKAILAAAVREKSQTRRVSSGATPAASPAAPKRKSLAPVAAATAAAAATPTTTSRSTVRKSVGSVSAASSRSSSVGPSGSAGSASARSTSVGRTSLAPAASSRSSSRVRTAAAAPTTTTTTTPATTTTKAPTPRLSTGGTNPTRTPATPTRTRANLSATQPIVLPSNDAQASTATATPATGRKSIGSVAAKSALPKAAGSGSTGSAASSTAPKVAVPLKSPVPRSSSPTKSSSLATKSPVKSTSRLAAPTPIGGSKTISKVAATTITSNTRKSMTPSLSSSSSSSSSSKLDVPATPQAVSSPALILPSPSPAPNASPELELFDDPAAAASAEEGLLSAADLSGTMQTETTDEENKTAEYDPDKDDDLDIDLDFSSGGQQPAASPKEAESVSALVMTPAKEDINVVLSPIQPSTPVSAPTPIATLASAAEPAPVPASPTPATLPPPTSTILASATESDKPVAVTTGDVASVDPSKPRLTMFGEEMDADAPDEDDDLEDLFASDAADDDDDVTQPNTDAAPKAAESVDNLHPFDLAAAAADPLERGADQFVEEEVTAGEEQVIQEDDLIEAIFASATTNMTTTTTTPSASDAPSLPMKIIISDASPLNAAPHDSAPIAAQKSVRLIRELTDYQKAILRLEKGCTFTSYTIGPYDTLKHERIFLWLNTHPSMLPGASEPSAGALFWCALPSTTIGDHAPPKWESDKRRIEIVTLADIWQGRQVGLFLRSEFETFSDAICVSFVAAAEPDGPPTQTLDLVAQSEEALAEFMDAFNAMLQGPSEEDIKAMEEEEAAIAAEKAAAAAAAVPAAVAPVEPIVLTSAHQPAKLPARISVPLLPDLSSGSLPLHLSSSPNEPHATQLLQIADFGNEGPEVTKVGQYSIAKMRAGIAIKLFEPSHSSRQLLLWRPAPIEYDGKGEVIPRADGPSGMLVLVSLPSSKSDSLAEPIPSPSPREIDPRAINEIVIGKFGGIFERHQAAMEGINPYQREIECANHARCIAMLLASTPSSASSHSSSSAVDSLDIEFDTTFDLLICLFAIRQILVDTNKSYATSLHTPPALSKVVPSSFQEFEQTLRLQTQKNLVDLRFRNDRSHFEKVLKLSKFDTFLTGLEVIEFLETSDGRLITEKIRVQYVYESAEQDGQFGSFYWNPALPSSSNGRLFVKSQYRRLDLTALCAIRRGCVDESTLLRRHAASLSRLQCDPASIFTFVSTDDLLTWSIPSSAASPPFLQSLETLLSWSGRSLLRIADSKDGTWMQVTGGEPTIEEIDEVEPFAHMNGVDTIESNANISQSTPTPFQTFVPPVMTPEFLAAVELLSKGRSFYSYFYSSASTIANEPIIDRSLVRIFFSRTLPTSPFPVDLYDIPMGETAFPALYKLSYSDINSPPLALRPEDMTPLNVMSMHELTDLFLGVHNEIFHTPAAMVLHGHRTFIEEECLSIVATGSNKRANEIQEWNLESITFDGLEEWLDALNLMLPLHVDEAEQAAAASAALGGSVAPVVLTPADSGAPSSMMVGASGLSDFPSSSSPISPLSPVRPLRAGADFLLLIPTRIGGETIARREKVRMFYVSPNEMERLGIKIQDATHYPSECLPGPGEEFIGALYYRPLPVSTPLSANDLLATRCVPLHTLTDIFHGRETSIWHDTSLSSESFNDDGCFSLVTERIEWNMATIETSDGVGAPTPDRNVVSEFLLGIQALLQSGGKDLEEGAGFGAQPNDPLSSIPFPLSPTSANILTPESSIEFILETMANKSFAFDSQLHAAGLALLHRIVARTSDSTSPSTNDLFHLGVHKQVVESMNICSRSEDGQRNGCTILWLMSTTPENELRLTQVGVIQTLLITLQNHVSNLQVSQQSTGALRILAVTLGNAEIIGISSGLEIILTTMKTHSNDVTIQEQGLGIIASVCANASNKTQFSSLGGIELVLGLLKRFPTHSSIQEYGCGCLRNLCANHISNKDLLLKLGGLEVLLTTISNNLPTSTSTSTMIHACGTLWNMTANHTSNKVQLLKLGGVKHLKHLFEQYQHQQHPNHSNEEELFGEIIGTLRNLSTVVDSKGQMCQEGSLEMGLTSMKLYPRGELIHRQASSLLFNLSDSDEHASKIVELDGLRILIDAIQTFITQKDIVEECCGTIWMCARAATAFQSISSALIVDLAGRVLSLHPDAPHATGMRNAWQAGAKANNNNNNGHI